MRRQLKTHVVSGSAAAFDYQEWLGISDEEVSHWTHNNGGRGVGRGTAGGWGRGET